MAAAALKRFLLLFRKWPAILAAACVLAVDVFDSFGLDQAADEQAARIVGTVTAPFYGSDGRRGQHAVTVVLIDDASLDFMGWPTPVPYDQQGDIVSALAAFEPAAIFLDLSYLRPHGEDAANQIRQFAQRLKLQSSDGGPAIMIGEVGEEAIFDPLREISSVGVAWQESSWLNYPLQDGDHRPMAAVALYNAWCARHDGACEADWSPPQVATPAPPQRLSLTWGFGASPQAAALSGREASGECVMRDTRFLTRLGVSLRESLGAFGRAFLYSERGDSAEARCIYTDTFNAATLLQGANDAALEPLVRGRVVLVGASHRQSADLQAIPHVGVVPGVYVHAMATDNLIEQESRFHRPPPEGVLALDFADLVEILLSIGLFVTVWLLFRAVERAVAGTTEAAQARRRRLLWAGAVTLAIVLAAAAAAIEYALHWPPLNVLGVIVLAAVVFGYIERHENRLAREPEASNLNPR
jgi:CHASE2 domain-containing sensor protein